MLRPVRTIVLLVSVAGLAASVRAQVPDGAVVYPDRVLVKLREESGAILDAGRLRSRSGSDLGTVSELFARAKRAERCIPLPLEILDRWHRDADQRLPAGRRRPGHLGLWFRLYAADAEDARSLRTALRTEPWVQTAEPELVPFLAGIAASTGSADDIPPVTPDLTALQHYVADAPTGFGFASAHRVAGTRGQRLRMHHAENEWRDDHEDLGSVGSWSYVNAPSSGASLPIIEHGTATLGVWVAQRNGFGMTGVVDAAEVRLTSWITAGGIAGGVARATLDSRPGDVLALIAVYNLAMVKPEDFVPAEYTPLDFDTILTATTQGLIVVEAAGNGDSDLDDPRFNLRFDRASRDSGAIMVAATDGALLQRAPFSNYGSRIDANGWGYEVGSTGYGTWVEIGGDQRQRYTEGYAGTSAATTLVAAVAGQIAGAARLQDGRALTPEEMRALLWSHGTAVPGQIGRRPDVPALLASLGLPDGLDVDRHEVDPGSTLTITMSGPADGVSLLHAAVGLGDLDLGWNRALLLDLSSLVSLGAFVRPNGSATLPVTVPNQAALRDATFYFQALEVDVQGGLRMSSVAEIHLR